MNRQNNFLPIIVNILFWAALVFVTVMSLIPSPPPGPLLFPGLDKIEHGCAYAGLAFLRYFCRPVRERRRSLLIIAALFLLGGGIEIVQGYTGRSPELADLAADFIGSLVGLGVAFLWERWFRKKTVQ